MNIDKFGRSSLHTQKRHGFQDYDIEISDDVFNLKKRRVVNINDPVEAQDASNKKYVDAKYNLLKNSAKKENELEGAKHLKVENIQEVVNEILSNEKAKLTNIILDYIYGNSSTETSIAVKPESIKDPLTCETFNNIIKEWRK